MEEVHESKYVKCNQKDYSMSFKLQVVQEVKRGELSQLAAKWKYGIQGRVLYWSGLGNMITLIGRTKRHQICLRRENNRSWNLSRNFIRTLLGKTTSNERVNKRQCKKTETI